MGGDQDKAVLSQINGIPQSAWRIYQNGFLSEFVHCMDKTQHSFRMIVIRRPVQGLLFDEKQERYTLIATNRTEGAEEVVQWSSKRGDSSENRIKDLKIGFGMERMPCGQFEANAVFFRIGVLAYNLGRLFVLKTLSSSWHSHQVQTLRWKLYETAGKVVFHGGAIWLKVRRSLQGLFADIRGRTWQFSCG